jgi:hypothetical protein
MGDPNLTPMEVPDQIGDFHGTNGKDINPTSASSSQPIVAPPVTLTPALTPPEKHLELAAADKLEDSAAVMAGKKINSLQRPDDAARELAKKLPLEEQVCLPILFIAL